MKYSAIYYFKDNTVCLCINMLDKREMRGQSLITGFDYTSKYKDFKVGDMVELEKNEIFFRTKVIQAVHYPLSERIKNIEKAYWHFLDCMDAGSHTLEIETEEIMGYKFSDISVYLTAETILQSYLKLITQLGKESASNLKPKIKQGKERVNNMRFDSQKVLGIDFSEYLGYNQQMIADMYPNMKKITGNKKLKPKEAVSEIHTRNKKYLTQTGEEIFGIFKNDLRSENGITKN